MTTTHETSKSSQMRLYNHENRRLYINASERLRFIEVANTSPAQIRIFCLTLLCTGCRLSEARELTKQAIQASEQLIAIRSLKKRDQHHIREIPIPADLVNGLFELQDDNLWSVDRITAYRWIKSVMQAANIHGPQACPKGLRHGFGIHATLSGVQLHMLQKWMGHADTKTTAIYANAVGAEELEIAARMWPQTNNPRKQQH